MKTHFLLFAIFWQAMLIAQVAPSFDSLKLVNSDTIYFASGSDELSTDALRQLSTFPDTSGKTDRLYLTGHTDNIGSDQFNEALAIRRAERVSAALNAKGWNRENTLVQTFGERNPVAANSAELGRQRNRRVTLDQYRAIPYVKISGRVINPDEKGIDGAMVRIHSRTMSDTLFTNEDGRFDLDLPVDSVVGIDVFARDHFFNTQIIRVKQRMKQFLDLEIKPAEIGAVADIENFYFYGDQAVLLPRSEPELPKLKLFLDVNPHLKIEIAGHVNVPNRPPIPKDSRSWDLSVRRAKMVYDYLIENGVPAEQLSYQGYGNHEMRFPRATSETRQAANRRVEIRILGLVNQ